MSIFKGLTTRRSARSGADGAPPAAANPGAAPGSAPGSAADAGAAPAATGATPAAPRGAEGDEAARGARNMWDLVSDTAAPPPTAAVAPTPAAAQYAPPEPPAESAFAAGWRRSGRVRTKLLGIDHSNGVLQPLEETAPAKPEPVRFPVGWLVVIEGPGRGHAFPLRPGVSQIGRGEEQTVPLDFGDTAISREHHALVAYDDEERRFYVGHGGKANLVRLNGKPLLSTEPMQHGDVLRLGETTLMLAALCGPEFDWEATEG
jgi:hypothetical protein